MRFSKSTIPILLGALLLVAACGGGATPASGTTDGAPTDPGNGEASVDPGGGATQTDEAPASEPPATEPPTGGGTTADVCGLVTVAEMESLFGVSGVTQQLFAGPPDTCDYRLDSAPFVAMVLTPGVGAAVFDATAADTSSELVSGLGDRALYNSQLLVLLVQKGGSLLTLHTLDESRSEEERFELMKQIGEIAAGRM